MNDSFALQLIRRRLVIRGVVQGVGFRPFMWTTAQTQGCTGWVRNSSDGVEAELQGSSDAVDAVIATIVGSPPPLARVYSIAQESLPPSSKETSFRILESDHSRRPTAFVSPDLATCADCLAEMRDPQNRRYGYPFLNCTHCGPRFTIQLSVPYDRSQTTMQAFPMCDLCRDEFENPADRRFHAQATACATCGPTIWYAAANSSADIAVTRPDAIPISAIQSHTQDVIRLVQQQIAIGSIVAIKGIGGFHLVCDARQPDTIARLRERKRRPFKPLAVMAYDCETAADFVELSETERQLLQSRERPIVLLRKRQGFGLPDVLAPANPYLGVLLPYSPLHSLLLKPGQVWVMTSGNLSDEPIAYDNRDAFDRLREIADGFLFHDRAIHVVCDDSVIRASSVGPIPIRRSRGYTPLPIPTGKDCACILSIGAELKSTVCLASDDHAFVGQHIGDMGNRETLLALERSCDHLKKLYGVEPQIMVADQHPAYLSTEYARRSADANGHTLVQVQHHHAHAVSLMVEHNLAPDQNFIACVFDGTGYGTDGTIWGGEVLIACAQSFERVAHLQPMPLPGGDQCILHPARTALGYLFANQMPWSDSLSSVQAFNARERQLLLKQLERGIHVVPTTSMGRLFDVVSSLVGCRQKIDYEGQAAAELEFLAESIDEDCVPPTAYSYHWSATRPSVLHIGAMLSEICADVRHDIPLTVVAMKFHQTIARAFTDRCVTLRDQHDSQQPLDCVGLTGGVFQNALLLRLMHTSLTQAGFQVLIHQVVPPNDGGISLGQAIIARHKNFEGAKFM